ncbi:hypothetical protein [Micromonospora deserti]|uniref:Uncharacterized protein n=1 Tax=Micromonospora deserti TaxID=2070366 RepID=A0A2W2CXZ8_9ACTN|nr:hypothetical protein [Micromonospora deserti]PZF92807.1 hypothetical protein C1I99_21305 [Micromonospora deserti]
MRILRSFIAAAAVALAAACSSAAAGDASSTADGSVQRLTQLAGAGMDMDYTALTSPDDAVSRADLVVKGTLVKVTDGIRFSSADPEVTKRAIGSYATFVIAVEEVLDGDTTMVTGGRVYVSMSTSSKATPQELDALNPQAKVVAVLEDITAWRPNGRTTVVRPAAIPVEARLYAAYNDGLWLQGAGDSQMYAISAEHSELAPAWGGPRTVDQLRTTIHQAAGAN